MFFLLGYPLGLLLLIVLSILTYFGVFHRVLDRMRLSDGVALQVLAAIVIGTFFDIQIIKGAQSLAVNVGGFLIPLGLVIYLLVKAGTNTEKLRALLAAVITSLAMAIVAGFEGTEPGTAIDSLYLFPIVAGLLAYVAGRSRRASFVAAVLGVQLYDVGNYFWLLFSNTRGTTDLGGGGAFDTTVIAGMLAVALAEIIGESRERLQGGPSSEGRDPELLKNLITVDKEDKDDA